MKRKDELVLEESLSEDWSRDLEVVQVPLAGSSIQYLRILLVLAGIFIAFHIIWLGVVQGQFFSTRATNNLIQREVNPAPRGVILDRSGMVLADNKSVSAALLNLRVFSQNPDLQEKTISDIERILGIAPEDSWNLITGTDAKAFAQYLVLSPEITQGQLVEIQALQSQTLITGNSFRRTYPGGEAFSSVLGYTGFPTARDLVADPALTSQEPIGKGGVELFYDKSLRGLPGTFVRRRDAKGNILGEEPVSPPAIGKTLSLTIDGAFQKYLYQRMLVGLQSLGRTSGAAIAMNPQTGEILSLVNFPTYDSQILSGPGHTPEKLAILNSPLQPLFDRAVAGLYSPGSTIKPLVGVAALAEGVIDPQKTIFSPGYLDVANPYDPTKPTRFLDWRYQGDVNLASAIAQSSDVYFYEVGGGAPGQKGLGVSALHDWWGKFNLGNPTGIDLPGESTGFLPTPDWKERVSGHPWLLGDTYNVSIGQGDLLITPIALLDYISAIANGGMIYAPTLNKDSAHSVSITTVAQYLPEIELVRKGMLQAVNAPLGTAYRLHDLPFQVAAKTGSAQIDNNTQENAFFVGYAPADHPQIALLILIEHSKEGSLNAVPIAKDVLAWYYQNRILKTN